MSTLKITRGDDVTLDITATDAGQPVDLTGAQAWFTAKLRQIDSDANAVFQKTTPDGITITNPGGGLAEVTIAPEDTAWLDSVSLWWDFQIKDGNDKVRTLATGRLIVEADVTRAIG